MTLGMPMSLRLVYPGLDIHYSTDSGLSQSDLTELSGSPLSETVGQSPLPVDGLAVHSRHFTLIPRELTLEDLGSDPLVQLGMSPDCPFASVSLDEWQATLLYSLESVNGGGFGHVTPSSIWQPLLVYFSELVNSMGSATVLVHLTPGRCHIVAGGPGRLHFFNTFAVKDPADLLYFTLKTLQEWKKSPESIPVRLSGHFEAGSPVFTLLSQYIVDLEVAPAAGLVLEGLDAFPPHRYIDLSSFAACASSAAS